MLVLALVNITAFMTDGVFNFGAFVQFLCVYILMCAALFFDVELPDKANKIAAAVMFALGPVLCFEMVRALVKAPVYDSSIYLDNLMFYAVAQLAVFALTQSVRASLITTYILSYTLHAANQIVLMARGTPFVPTDFYAITTAMTVTTPTDWHFDAPLLTGTAACLLLIAIALKIKVEYKRILIRITACLCSCALAAAGMVYIYKLDYMSYSTSTFDTESTNNVNGIALSFYINARKMKFDKPEGYSVQEMNEYLDRYEDETLSDDAELPNIIVIMNESFADLKYMGKLRTNVPYMPYYNELTKKFPHGKLLVSALGGGTCNTEFEFLTGLSMMYMPNGCYAYMQHVKQDLPSMASYLKEYGYSATAMHPFYEICWKRNMVYDLMGFDDFISGEDMTDYKSKYVSAERWEKGFGDDVEYVRTLISDSFFYDRIIEEFENKTSERAFIFGVTVQNHSGYEYDGEDFTSDVHITNYDGYYPRAEQYLSLVKKSDEALKELITYFEGVDEKTLIVFFGDHQPNIEVGLLNQIAPYRNAIVNSFLSRYETPFLIWANYDIGGRDDLGVVSPNFLGVKTLEYAGIPLSKEYQMIRDVQKITPAMNTWGYFDRFITWNEREESYDEEILNVYNFYTYYTLHNKPAKTK